MFDRPLVGRARELGELISGLDRACEGRGSVQLLAGEPGIGKSRLAEEVANAAQERNAIALFGRCWEAGGAPAFWPWVEILRALFDPMDESERARVLGAGVTDVAQIVPELSEAKAAQLAPVQDRFRLFDAITNALVRASSRRPIALFFEDLHAADSPSLLLLTFVAQRVGQQRIYIVGTYRDLEARLSPEISELLRKIDRGGRTLLLSRLGQDEVALLCASAGVTLAARVFEATEGNPLFIDQLLRILEVRGDDPSAVEIPDHVKDAIRERVARVGADDLAVLEVGAAIGRTFPSTIVARSLETSIGALRTTFSRAVGLGLISELPGGRYSFTHVLIRDVVHDAIPVDRSCALHRRIADVLEELHAGDPEAPLREIAHHLALAGPSSAGRALEVLSQASAHAMKMLAFEEAIALSQEALELLELAAPGDAERRFDLLLAVAHAQMQSGQYERGKESCLSAAKLARQLGSPERIARAALELGWRLQVGIVDRTLADLLQEAADALPASDTPLRARVIARLAAALQPAPNPRGPIDMALGAVEMAHRISDRSALLWVLQWAGSALMHFAPVQERISVDEETVAIAVELRDKANALRGYGRMIWDYVENGDFARADECIRAYENLAAEFRQPHVSWQACLFRSMRALMEGRFDDSTQEQANARKLAELTNDPLVRRHLAIHALYAAVIKGDRADVAVRLDALPKPTPLPLVLEFCKLVAAPLVGDRATVRAALDRYLTMPFDSDPGNIMTVAEVALQFDDVALAESLDRVTAQHRDHFCHTGLMGFTCEGPMERGAMAIAALLGRWDDAESYFQRAHRSASQVGARPLVAHIEINYAQLLMRRGRSEDRARAASLAGSAASIGRQLGMLDFASRAAAFAETVGAPAEAVESYGGGRYAVKRLLGRGGHKTVYLVHDGALERECALAVIDQVGGEERERLRSEGLALARMGTHPNVVTVFDIGEEAGRPYLVMELVAGGDLGALLKSGPLEVSRAMQIGRDLLRGLAAIHERGIVHRDVKPSNVWLDEAQNAKIGDFGIAVRADRERMTQPGELSATVEYASPEQLENRAIDARSDLYSLGCLLYELCTGRTPFVGTAAEVIEQHLRATPAAPSSHAPKISEALDRFVLHLMAKSPEHRPADARKALAELDAIDAIDAPRKVESRARDEKLASLADLVAGIAHEMNTPLGALQANADVLLRSIAMIEEALGEGEARNDPRVARALATLARAKGVTPEATQRLSRIVRDLKSFARLDQADEELFDLTEGLDATLAMLRHETADRITIIRSYREVPPIRCRPAQMNQAFLSILKNSVQAISERGTITVTTANEGDAVAVRIADTGAGISEANLGRIFDPGFTTKGVGVGTGLGLSIAYQVVQEHAGSIEVESAVGQGSVFVIRLPVRAAAGDLTAPM